jgi:hypothetical protein
MIVLVCFKERRWLLEMDQLAILDGKCLVKGDAEREDDEVRVGHNPLLFFARSRIGRKEESFSGNADGDRLDHIFIRACKEFLVSLEKLKVEE